MRGVDGDLVRYKDLSHRRFEQRDHFNRLTLYPFDGELESRYGEVDETGFVAMTDAFSAKQDRFKAVANRDAAWSVFAILFVFAYFCFHLRSLFLATIGITIVLFSFPLTVVIAKICSIKYFTTLHMLMIFIVLGIAADDIFVFYDAWRQSAQYPMIASDKKKRMAYTFRRASRAMAMTSSTTAVAFLANIFSPIMPIKSFGIYSGIIVPLNFLMTITMFPPATIIYETYFEDSCFGSSGKCPTPTKSGGTGSPSSTPVSTEPATDRRLHEDGSPMPTGSTEADSEDAESRTINHEIEDFFGSTWHDAVFRLRPIIFVVFGAWFGVACWKASQLSPLTSEEVFVPESHPSRSAEVLVERSFTTANEEMPEVDIFWGGESIDKSNVHPFNATYAGEVVMDESFDVAAPESQQFLYDFCQDLESQSFIIANTLSCWIMPFKSFVELNGVFPVAE